MAKRNCRRTDTEREIHEQAVSLRKLTDEQLVQKFKRTQNKSTTEKELTDAYNRGNLDGSKAGYKLFREEFLLEAGDIKGIGAATLDKLKRVIESMNKLSTGGNGQC